MAKLTVRELKGKSTDWHTTVRWFIEFDANEDLGDFENTAFGWNPKTLSNGNHKISNTEWCDDIQEFTKKLHRWATKEMRVDLEEA